MPAELAIIIPTYNEHGNLAAVVRSLEGALPDCSWELVFVDDDSPDGSASLARDLARRDPRVRCIQRLGRRGLASASIEGVLSTASPYICIMDADLQHDERIIPDMLGLLKRGTADIVIGSRYLAAGGTGALAPHRVWISRVATTLCRALTRVEIADPMSGFFMIRRSVFEEVMRRLSGRGFKILLDILLSAQRPVACVELPYVMRARTCGASKLSPGVAWDLMLLVAHKLLGRMIPSRFISFAAVGASGVVLHLLVLWVLYRIATAAFVPAQSVATLAAMTSNFILNNYFTYSDRRLHGVQFVRGLLSFYLACAFGALINVALAGYLFEKAFPWWLAGFLGAVAGAVWNYAVTAVFTWKEEMT